MFLSCLVTVQLLLFHKTKFDIAIQFVQSGFWLCNFYISGKLNKNRNKMLGFHIVHEERVPVQASAEVVCELHLQRLTRVFEGSKLTEEVPHLSTFTSLLKSKNLPLFSQLTLSSLAMRTCPMICPTVARSMFRFLTLYLIDF